MTRRSGRLRRALLVPCVVPAACADGDGGPASGGTPTSSAASPTPSAAPSPSPTPETLSERSVVRLDGIGPVRVGMTLAEASAAAGVTFVEGVGAGTDERRYAAAGRKPGEERGPAFMIVGEKIARVDVEGGTYATEAGVGIGDTGQKVLGSHGAANVSSGPHVFTEGGKYLIVTSTDPALSNHRLIYETDASGKFHVVPGRPDAGGPLHRGGLLLTGPLPGLAILDG